MLLELAPNGKDKRAMNKTQKSKADLRYTGLREIICTAAAQSGKKHHGDIQKLPRLVNSPMKNSALARCPLATSSLFADEALRN